MVLSGFLQILDCSLFLETRVNSHFQRRDHTTEALLNLKNDKTLIGSSLHIRHDMNSSKIPVRTTSHQFQVR